MSNVLHKPINILSRSTDVYVEYVKLSGKFICDISFWQAAPKPVMGANWIRKFNTGDKWNAVTKPVNLSECMLNKYDKVVFVGDSHIRYVYMYTKLLQGYMRPGEQNKFLVDSYKNIDFIFVTYAEGYAKALGNVEKKLRSGNKILLLTSLGAWDTQYRTPPTFVKDVQKGLVKLESLMKKYDITMVWQTIPPVSIRISNTVGLYNMVKLSNTFVNSALNRWLGTLLQSIGVHVIDILELARAVKDANICVGH